MGPVASRTNPKRTPPLRRPSRSAWVPRWAAMILVPARAAGSISIAAGRVRFLFKRTIFPGSIRVRFEFKLQPHERRVVTQASDHETNASLQRIAPGAYRANSDFGRVGPFPP